MWAKVGIFRWSMCRVCGVRLKSRFVSCPDLGGGNGGDCCGGGSGWMVVSLQSKKRMCVYTMYTDDVPGIWEISDGRRYLYIVPDTINKPKRKRKTVSLCQTNLPKMVV